MSVKFDFHPLMLMMVVKCFGFPAAVLWVCLVAIHLVYLWALRSLKETCVYSS